MRVPRMPAATGEVFGRDGIDFEMPEAPRERGLGDPAVPVKAKQQCRIVVDRLVRPFLADLFEAEQAGVKGCVLRVDADNAVGGAVGHAEVANESHQLKDRVDRAVQVFAAVGE